MMKQHVSGIEVFGFFSACKKSLAIFIAFLFFSCAKVVAPGGGPIDNDPPLKTEQSAENLSLSLKEDKISFRFNEFFTLKNPSQNLYLNPLFNSDIEYKVKGKTLIVTIPKELAENQTYVLAMDNLIADFHEGNILRNFNFVFSTGPVIDSLVLRGRAVDASTGEPLDNAGLYLFPSDVDSALLKKQFAYYAKSSADGVFEFLHLPEGEYKLCSLHEKNVDHILNSPEEKVGFYEIPLNIRVQVVNDSMISVVTKLDKPLSVFSEKDSVLKITKTAKIKKGLYQIVFSQPVSEVMISPVDQGVADTVFVTQFEPGDSVSLWVINSKKDAAAFVISSDGLVLDTVTIALKTPAKGSGRSDDIPELKLKIPGMFDQNRVHYFQPVVFRSSTPIKEIHQDSIFLISGNDTLQMNVQFSPGQPLEFRLPDELIPGKNYSLFLLNGALKDYYGTVNDSLQIQFQLTDSSYYGKVIVKLNNLRERCHLVEIAGKWKTYIVQLNSVSEGNTCVFEKIIPGEYSVRYIEDVNCNWKWDTGDFRTHRHPESVTRLKEKVLVRSNWESEMQWTAE